MIQTYTDLSPTFPDRADWTLARVLDRMPIQPQTPCTS